MGPTSKMPTGVPADAVLVESFLAGDHAAFGEIVNRYREMVHGLVMRITGNAEDAEDAFQDTFFSLATKLDRFEGRSSLKTWVYRVAVNAALMVIRGRKKHAHVEIDTGAEEFDDEGRYVHVVADWSTLPETDLLSREAERILLDAIHRLPDRFRTVVELADLERCSNREIGDRMGLSLAAVKSRLHRARLVLRRELAAYFDKKVTHAELPHQLSRRRRLAVGVPRRGGEAVSAA